MKRLLPFVVLFFACNAGAQTLRTNNAMLDSAFRLAVWTIDHNTHSGIVEAGAGYGGEWTRDASINCWNAVSLLRPAVAEKTLWSVTEPAEPFMGIDDSLRVGHQYWDKIIWALAAWHHFQVTADTAFLRRAYNCAWLTMEELMLQCYDGENLLFMGPAVFRCFYEIYTLYGQPSGGWQCQALWDVKERQTWCATGYLRLWLDHVFGIQCGGGDLLEFCPMGMQDGSECVLDGIRWRDTEVCVIVRGHGRTMHARVNGTPVRRPAIANTGGKVTIEIELTR